jgi:hypothetical protein
LRPGRDAQPHDGAGQARDSELAGGHRRIARGLARRQAGSLTGGITRGLTGGIPGRGGVRIGGGASAGSQTV